MLSLRMIPLLTSAPFLFAAKLSSQRFKGVLAWLKICRRDKYTIHLKCSETISLVVLNYSPIFLACISEEIKHVIHCNKHLILAPKTQHMTRRSFKFIWFSKSQKSFLKSTTVSKLNCSGTSTLSEPFLCLLDSPCRTCDWAIEAPQGKWSAAGPSCHLEGDGCRPDRTQSVLHGSKPQTAETDTQQWA